MIKIKNIIALCASAAVLAAGPLGSGAQQAVEAFGPYPAEGQTASAATLSAVSRSVNQDSANQASAEQSAVAQSSVGQYADGAGQKLYSDLISADLGTVVPDKLIPMGTPIGIKLYSEGIIVSGFSEVQTGNGRYSPAQRAGLKKGDVILKINGEKLETTEQFERLISESAGNPLTLEVMRSGRQMILTATPAVSPADGKYRIGAWIRDSMAGIGTVSFIDPDTGIFGALGHSVSDSDSGALIPLRKGSVMNAQIKGVKKGVSGIPGALEGLFDLIHDIGIINANTPEGIFGRITDSSVYRGRVALPVATRDQVKTGNAYVVCTVDGGKPTQYKIEIEKIYSKSSDEKNMLIHVTDPELLAKTGGIVQGMSGSPILQDGRIVGAVTHVLVNDPEKGYGIFIQNMLDNAYEANSPREQAAA